MIYSTISYSVIFVAKAVPTPIPWIHVFTKNMTRNDICVISCELWGRPYFFYRKPCCSFVIWTAAPRVLSSSITCHRIGSGLKMSSPPECHTVSCHLYPSRVSPRIMQIASEVCRNFNELSNGSSDYFYLFLSLYIVRTKWTEYDCTKVGGKCLFRRSKRRWKINIRTMHIVDCIRLSQDKDPRVP